MNVELVAFGIEHVDEVAAALFDRPAFSGSQLQDPVDLRIDPAPSFALRCAKSAPDVQVQMTPVLDALLFRHLLEEDAGAGAIRIDDGAGGIPLVLGNPLRSSEGVPR